MAAQLGLSVYKVGMSWPLDPEGMTEFAAPLEKMLVVEEKRGLIEPQIKDCLYGQEGAPAIMESVIMTAAACCLKKALSMQLGCTDYCRTASGRGQARPVC